MQIILASASPRRRQLLKQITEDFTVDPAVGEEKAEGGLTPAETACRLAENKCAEVFSRHKDCLVVASDTIVVFGGKILGKPKDKRDAVETLTALSGNTHSVITAVCVRSPKGKRTDYAETKVAFNRLSREFINDYVDGGSPLDKAGSYGIQDGGIVASYEGSYENVVGLPLELTKKLIEEMNL